MANTVSIYAVYRFVVTRFCGQIKNKHVLMIINNNLHSWCRRNYLFLNVIKVNLCAFILSIKNQINQSCFAINLRI